MRSYLPPLPLLPPDASEEERRRRDLWWLADVVRYNPDRFLPPGVRARWWHTLLCKFEYPKELLE